MATSDNYYKVMGTGHDTPSECFPFDNCTERDAYEAARSLKEKAGGKRIVAWKFSVARPELGIVGVRPWSAPEVEA
jgi:hypothetical protein